MSPERWKRIEHIFNEALVHTGDQAQFLDSACNGDSTLRSEISLLLRHTSEDETSLDLPALMLVANEFDEVGSLFGQEITAGPVKDRYCGPYRLLRLIGSGGMGSVYLAERADGEVEQRAAVKLLRYGTDDPAFHRRFLLERQILATLSHPAIARLLDAGHTADGQPYLVMEYIDGVPIDHYSEKFDLRRKLRLFRQVCDAVSYAHRNLIVHRDLKPSNILIDQEGQPKLLDFGIAKIIEAGGHQEHTSTSLRALTPSFASPEQIRGDLITTSSDVYSLGVLLYKLLTGRFPYEFTSLSPAAIDHIVCEVEPTPPGLGQDINNILLMALRKEPSRRYGSVQQFADDIDRVLSDRPVLARANTVGYRAAKFIQRNRLSLTAITLVLVAVLTGSIIALQQARLAQQRFQDVRKLAHTFVFNLHDEVTKLEGSTKAREIIVRTGLEYLNNLARNAGGDLDLQKEIATGYTKIGDAEGNPNFPNLGRIGAAIASYQKAGKIYERIAAKNQAYLTDLGWFYLQYAALVRFNHDLIRARSLSELAIQTLDRVHSRGVRDARLSRSYVAAWCTLGDMDEDLGHYRQAWSSFSRCRDLAREQLKSIRNPRTLSDLAQADERIATAAAELGHLTEALQALDEDESVLRQLLATEPHNPKFHRRLALVDSYRAAVFYHDSEPNLGDPVRALESAQRYLARAEEMVRSDPNNTSAQFSLAVALYEVSFSLRTFNSDAAVNMAKASLRKFDNLIASGRASFLVTSRRTRALVRLGEAEFKAGQIMEARHSAELVIAANRSVGTGTEAWSQQRAVTVSGLVLAGKVNEASGDFERAEELFQEAREQARSIAKNGELENLIPLANTDEVLGGFYARRRSNQARVCYQQLVDLWQHYPEQSEYVDRKKLAATRLLASLR